MLSFSGTNSCIFKGIFGLERRILKIIQFLDRSAVWTVLFETAVMGVLFSHCKQLFRPIIASLITGFFREMPISIFENPKKIR